MKRFFTFVTLLLLTAAVGGLVIKASMPAPAEGEATLVIHFHTWNDDYENIGGHLWGGKALVEVDGTWEKLDAGIQPTGQDEFGIYFTVRYEAGENAADVGFIPVKASVWHENGTIVQNWDAKFSADDVLIPVKGFEAGSEHHVYIFEGSRGILAKEEEGEVPFLMADPEMVNMLLVFFDPAGTYHEDLGVHSWGWKEGQNASGWNMVHKPFANVGFLGSTPVKAAIFSQKAESVGDAGLLVYHGDGDGSKYTGDIKQEVTPDVGIYDPAVKVGIAVPVYVLSAGGGNDSNNNVFYGETLEDFGVEATTFRFDLGSVAKGAGTFALTSTVVYTMFNQAITTNFLTKEENEKEEFKNELMEMFGVFEVVDGERVGNSLPIVGINFNEYADEAKEFILTLGTELDVTKDYEVGFKEILPPEKTLKTRTIKFEVEAPEGTPNVYVVGSMTGWTPGRENWKLEKGQDGIFRLEVQADLLPKTMEYKYVYAPGWDYEEDVAGNRQLVIGTESTILVEDTVTWKTAPDEADVYPAEEEALALADDEPFEFREAYAELDIDREAPELIFISDFDIESEKVIYILQNSRWDQHKFPRFRVNDNRDGDILHRVYVPADQPNKMLDTGKLGDYPILLRVEDDWGHVTEVIFIFRVVKEIPGK